MHDDGVETKKVIGQFALLVMMGKTNTVYTYDEAFLIGETFS